MKIIIREISNQNRLESWEIPNKIFLEHEPFTIQNQLLTSTQKLRRKNLFEKYSSLINQLFQNFDFDQLETKKKRPKIKGIIFGFEQLPMLGKFLQEVLSFKDNENWMINVQDMRFVSLGGDSLSGMKFIEKNQ